MEGSREDGSAGHLTEVQPLHPRPLGNRQHPVPTEQRGLPRYSLSLNVPSPSSTSTGAPTGKNPMKRVPPSLQGITPVVAVVPELDMHVAWRQHLAFPT